MNTAPISDEFIQSLGPGAHFVQFLHGSPFQFAVCRPIANLCALHPFINDVLNYRFGPFPTHSHQQCYDMPLPVPVREYKDGDNIVCLHGQACRIQCVKNNKSRNFGRRYVRCQQTPCCSFFRWLDELQDGTQGMLTLQDKYLDAVSCPTIPQQLKLWKCLQQGSTEWLDARRGRVTASNFGTVNGTNPYNSKHDYLRTMLWDIQCTGMAMKWGSCHEELAYSILKKLLSSPRVWFETNGIWIAENYPYLGASPDGIIYVVESAQRIDAEFEVLICNRFLIEIKVPWCLRQRVVGESFYAENDIPDTDHKASIPLYYYDQINGNCNLIGLRGCFFFVLSPTGWHLTYLPNDVCYWEKKLQPVLTTFYCDMVQPSIQQQQAGELPVGTTPFDNRSPLIFTL